MKQQIIARPTDGLCKGINNNQNRNRNHCGEALGIRTKRIGWIESAVLHGVDGGSFKEEKKIGKKNFSVPQNARLRAEERSFPTAWNHDWRSRCSSPWTPISSAILGSWKWLLKRRRRKWSLYICIQRAGNGHVYALSLATSSALNNWK